MLETSNTDLFNPLLVPEAHNSQCQNILFPLEIKPVKVSLRIFIFAPSALMGQKQYMKGLKSVKCNRQDD